MTTLTGPGFVLRDRTAPDAPLLFAILSEPSIVHWWGTPKDAGGDDDTVVLVVEVDGQVAGAIQYTEENDPDYRHASIDVYLATHVQGRGLGPRAISLLAAHLIDDRGHHRLTIDPAATNARAIRAYERVGFRPVGVMRAYERSPDGTWHDGLLMDLLARELVRLDDLNR